MNKSGFSALAASVLIGFSALPAFAGEALDRIEAAKTLTIATDANWAPQSFLNEQNEMDGFDVDVGKEIGKRLGWEVNFITPGWDIITAGNWQGRWDMHVGSMTPTNARAEVFSFPAIYYYTPAAVVVHEDSSVTALSELNGKAVGVTTASTFEAYANQDLTLDVVDAPGLTYEFQPGEVKSFANTSTALDDLRLGAGVRLDGVISSLPSLLNAIEAGYPLVQLGDPIFYEPLAVAIELGDPELTDMIAGAIEEMKADGTLSALSVKWYGVDYSLAE
jgi:polar amino acid transport system substrate-binding protein|tara:strand:+ start:2833 stop:3663 length:831 start_codon:yes stop_codon:yes gene_type:complete